MFLPFPVNDVVTDWSYAQENGMLAAWSLSALLGLMPFQIIENNRFGFYQVKGFNKQGETYRFGYKTNNSDAHDSTFDSICPKCGSKTIDEYRYFPEKEIVEIKRRIEREG